MTVPGGSARSPVAGWRGTDRRTWPNSQSRRLRIAVDGRVLQDRYHGIGRHTFELVRELSSRDVELIVLHGRRRSNRFDLTELGGPRVRLVEFDVSIAAPLAQLRWPGVLKALQCDVLLVPYHLGAPWFHPAIPVVTMVHDCIFESQPAAAPTRRRFRAGYRLVTRLALTRASVVCTVSEATRKDLQRFYGVELTDDAVLPHGVAPRFFNASGGRPSTGMPLPERYVLHVGVRRPHKNQAVLVEALRMMTDTLSDVGLVLVGQRDERFVDRLEAQVAAAGLGERVHLLTSVSDDQLLRLYANAAAFAYPSTVEGFGLPLLEAMAAGVPVVASDAAAVVEASGGAALIVPAEEPLAWAQALRTLLGSPDLALDLQARGRKVAAARTWSASADRTLHILERAAIAGRATEP